MADIIFKGGFNTLTNGSIIGSPDIRLKLVMSGFSGATEKDSVNIADLSNLDEFDGLGYVELDCANVAFTYDTGNNDYSLTFDAGEFNAPAGSVSPGSDSVVGLVVYLYVDGTDANDVLIGFTDSGGFPFVGANSAISYTPHPDGILVLREL